MIYTKYKIEIKSFKYQKGVLFILRKSGNYCLIFKNEQFGTEYNVFITQNFKEAKKTFWQIVKNKIVMCDLINTFREPFDCEKKFNEKMDGYVRSYNDVFLSKYLRMYFKRKYNLEISGEVTSVIYYTKISFKERLERYIISYFRHNFTDYDTTDTKLITQDEKRIYFNGIARKKMKTFSTIN